MSQGCLMRRKRSFITKVLSSGQQVLLSGCLVYNFVLSWTLLFQKLRALTASFWEVGTAVSKSSQTWGKMMQQIEQPKINALEITISFWKCVWSGGKEDDVQKVLKMSNLIFGVWFYFYCFKYKHSLKCKSLFSNKHFMCEYNNTRGVLHSILPLLKSHWLKRQN